jgi:short-subunit dehydrogenase
VKTDGERRYTPVGMARILIVGATSAIAARIAQRFAQRGEKLFLLGRDVARLDALAQQLGSAVVGRLAADLDETERNAERIAEASAALGGIDIAILAHGLLGDQVATEHDFATAHDVITTNFSSMVSLLIPLANEMEAAGAGRIAVLSSVAGERGRPRNYTYGAAKGALTLYLQGLRSRLWDRGVTVHTFKLGPVDTPMTLGHPKNALFATADRVAADIVGHLRGRGGERYVPWYWAPIMGVVRRMPEPLFQRFGFLSGR